jgi:hypothetical protein
MSDPVLALLTLVTDSCHVSTVDGDILKKLNLLATDLEEYSLETVGIFHTGASSSGCRLGMPRDFGVCGLSVAEEVGGAFVA